MEVSVDINTLLDFLDQCEGGLLYPAMDAEDTIIRVSINALTAEFELGKRHSAIRNKSKGV